MSLTVEDPEKQLSPASSGGSLTIDFVTPVPDRDPPTVATVDPSLLTVPTDGTEKQPAEKEESILSRRPSTPYPGDSPRLGSMIHFDDQPNWPKGWRPYACLVGCFLLMWNSWGIVNAYGTYQSYYSQHLFASTPLMLLNLIGSTQSFVVLVLSFIIGRLLDANYARYLVATGTFLVIIGHFVLSVVNGDGITRDSGNYGATWATQGLVVGLGQACFFVSSSQIASTWFIKRKAVAIGIVASGASIAGLVYPIMIKFLITKVGYNNAVRYNATVIAVTAIIAFLLAVPNPHHTYRKPERWMDTSVWIDTHALNNKAWLWFTASICFVFFGFYAVFFNLEDWAAHNGFAMKDVPPGFDVSLGVDGSEEVPKDAIRTFWLLCILNVSSTAGRLFSAGFAERFGALNIHFISTFLGSILLFSLWTFAKSLAPALVFVIVFGAVSGSIIGLPPASIAHILGRTDPSQQAKLGQWTGMMYTASSPFALTGPVIVGYLINHYGPNNYLTVQMWSGTCLILATICMGIARCHSGPSKTIDLVKDISRTISRSTTLEGADGLRSLYVPGLGRKMARSRQASGVNTGVNTPAARNRSPSPASPQAEAGARV